MNLREGDVEFPRSWTEKSGGGVHTGAQVEGEASPGRPRRLATQAGKQAACLLARTRCCARGGRAGQGAGDPHRITVAGPYPPPFCLLQKFGQNLN